MTAGIPLILRKTGAHLLRLRAIALALRGAPLQQPPFLCLSSFNRRFTYRFEVVLNDRPILPRRAFAVLHHILCGAYRFVIDRAVIQLRALLPAGLFNVGPAVAAAAHAFYGLMLKTHLESCGCAFIGTPLALLFRDAKPLATSRLFG